VLIRSIYLNPLPILTRWRRSAASATARIQASPLRHLAAIDSDELDRRRFENYLKLKREARYDGLSSREIENEKIKAMVGSKAEWKRMIDAAKKKNDGR
jgi:hypothetical protein